MNWSTFFIPMVRETPSDATLISHQLLLKSGMIHQLSAGVHTILPLGQRVLNKIHEIIRGELSLIGANELSMPCLTPKSLWEATGRDVQMREILLQLQGNDWRMKTFLGATHEEVVTSLAKTLIRSYKQLPLTLYQIQTKFRNEPRPEGGLIRGREFLMKDAYSFHASRECLDRTYEQMKAVYADIFAACELEIETAAADAGDMGGQESMEFASKAKDGSLIEVAHIFKLGTKYSEAMDAKFQGTDNKLQAFEMGCYGIGITRLMSAIIEQHHDKDGIVWPERVAPFDFIITQIEPEDEKVRSLSLMVEETIKEMGMDVLVDNRLERPGVKFAQADMVGAPFRITIGKRGIAAEAIEIRFRKDGKVVTLPPLSIIRAAPIWEVLGA